MAKRTKRTDAPAEQKLQLVPDENGKHRLVPVGAPAAAAAAPPASVDEASGRVPDDLYQQYGRLEIRAKILRTILSQHPASIELQQVTQQIQEIHLRIQAAIQG